MSFSTKNVWVAGDAKDLQPSGSAVPIVRADIGVRDVTNQQLTVNTILASASAGADKQVAYDDLLLTELVTFLDNHIDVTLGVDVTGNTVDYNFTVQKIRRGLVDNDIFFNDVTAVYVITGVLEYAIS